MDNKLTLKLDNQVIERAKHYARKKNTSLSRLVEAYLKLLTSAGSAEAGEITPLVKSLSGAVQASRLKDSQSAYKKYLAKKYSK
jgi:hypothetical protein